MQTFTKNIGFVAGQKDSLLQFFSEMTIQPKNEKNVKFLHAFPDNCCLFN
ncbi:hypothetical protein NtB2_01597 [Lactococcus termiticola]|uniref:Uncharacterized protein n=1 Tax=Lactococcus termiticola TaxID=2169526 RepID=A0A2R5HHJ6_9LACT|nr:hypothetical protein NtB2_01597 [Lactococcus termiticola]